MASAGNAVVLLLIIFCLPGQSLAGQVGYYSGEINASQNRSFFERYRDKALSVVEIDSPGGEVEAGIELGLWVYRQGLDIRVNGVCLSSCANYVFTAGRDKSVLPGSVVAWHGNYHHLDNTGLWQDDVALRMRRDGEDRLTATNIVRSQVDRLVALEKSFFSEVAVEQFLCWIGKVPPYNVANYYTLSAGDMARFGVNNVRLPAGYLHMDMSAFDVDIQVISLVQPGD